MVHAFGFEELNRNRLDNISVYLPGIIFLSLLNAELIVLQYYTSKWISVLSGVIAIFGFVLAAGYFKTQKVPIKTEKRSVRILAIIFLFMFFMNYYSLMGINKARRVAEGRSKKRITIHMKSKWQPPEKAMLIGQMGGRYFICSPTPRDKKPEVIVIQESEVERVTISQSEKSDIPTQTEHQKPTKPLKNPTKPSTHTSQ